MGPVQSILFRVYLGVIFVSFASLNGLGSFHPANATKESFATPAAILILDSDSCENPLTCFLIIFHALHYPLILMETLEVLGFDESFFSYISSSDNQSFWWKWLFSFGEPCKLWHFVQPGALFYWWLLIDGYRVPACQVISCFEEWGSHIISASHLGKALNLQRLGRLQAGSSEGARRKAAKKLFTELKTLGVHTAMVNGEEFYCNPWGALEMVWGLFRMLLQSNFCNMCSMLGSIFRPCSRICPDLQGLQRIFARLFLEGLRPGAPGRLIPQSRRSGPELFLRPKIFIGSETAQRFQHVCWQVGVCSWMFIQVFECG